MPYLYSMSSYSKINSSKRGQFEDQLRSLQSDIAELSSKLSIPQAIVEEKNHFINNSQVSNSSGFTNMDNIPTNMKGNVARLKKENHDLQRERDEYHFRYEQMSRELEDVKRVSHELGKYKAMYDNLKHDYDSLKGSLDSSERIRKQQKELIQLMQRSNNIVGQVVTNNSSFASCNDVHNLSMSSGHSMFSHLISGGDNRSVHGGANEDSNQPCHETEDDLYLGIAGGPYHTNHGQHRPASAPSAGTKTPKTAKKSVNRQLNISSNSSTISHNNSQLNNSYRSTSSARSARVDHPQVVSVSSVQVARSRQMSAMKRRRQQEESIANLMHGAASNGVQFAHTHSSVQTATPRPKYIHRVPKVKPDNTPVITSTPSSRGKPPRPTVIATPTRGINSSNSASARSTTTFGTARR